MSVTFLTAPELRRMLKQVSVHMSDDDTLPILSAVHLESQNGTLYTFATDRFTMAVARASTVVEGDWAAPISAGSLPSVIEWLKSAGTAGIRVSAAVDGDLTEITLSSPTDKLHVSSSTRTYSNPPNWRALIKGQMDAKAEMVPVTGFDTRFLARWKHAGPMLMGWHGGPSRALILMNDDGSFIGIQMPIRVGPTRAELSAKWEDALSPLAHVDGQSYRLDVQWADADGDPWEYTGRTRNGQPLMRLVGIDEDDRTFAQLVAEFSPLRPVPSAA
ncbi:phiSA1p31-related protein [Streptomyces sp. H27-G5]|uniref:DNA polymerase III subunit beta family protein n=1 Tax=Streptomyces sp. H27-G5 TaxID=2996698 RepID=UPI00226E300F|nr:phiSA1p31-related protein [Streptomyces sp. H27-G5]MCY0916974.1 phiSA1p31-related protein [Streptomyces sp. H27-G5]